MQMILYYIQSFLLSYRTLTNPMVVSAPKLFFLRLVFIQYQNYNHGNGASLQVS